MAVIGSSGGIGLDTVHYPVEPLRFPFEESNAAITIGMHDTVAVAVSPFTGSQQVQEWLAGQWWTMTCVLPPMHKGEARTWVAFLAACRGRALAFFARDTSLERPRGSFAGNPVVDGSGQTGQTLMVRGLTPNTPKVARSGDYIQLGNDHLGQEPRMYSVLADVNSDSAGKVTLDIWPRIRLLSYDHAPLDGDTVFTSYCKAPFRLASNDRQFTVDNAMTYGITFDAVEKL